MDKASPQKSKSKKKKASAVEEEIADAMATPGDPVAKDTSAAAVETAAVPAAPAASPAADEDEQGFKIAKSPKKKNKKTKDKQVIIWLKYAFDKV